jgi:hypothetical protein
VNSPPCIDVPGAAGKVLCDVVPLDLEQLEDHCRDHAGTIAPGHAMHENSTGRRVRYRADCAGNQCWPESQNLRVVLRRAEPIAPDGHELAVGLIFDWSSNDSDFEWARRRRRDFIVVSKVDEGTNSAGVELPPAGW